MRKLIIASSLISWILVPAWAQESRPVSSASPQASQTEKKAAVPADLQDVVKRDFGDDIVVDMASPTPFLEADFNGDGSLDAAIVVHSKGLTEKGDYKMIDPYDEYFGYGNVTVTSQFESDEPSHKHAVLIIHGSGPEGWRTAHPKEKFVIINMPFDTLKLMNARYKKKSVVAIKTHDSTGVSAVLLWTGKKYYWEPGAMDE